MPPKYEQIIVAVGLVVQEFSVFVSWAQKRICKSACQQAYTWELKNRHGMPAPFG